MNTWPEYELIERAKCFVDMSYQRPETRIVKRIADNWRPEQFGVIVASARGDGRYAIVDGQQRWSAAALRDMTHLPALVHNGLTLAQEADLFVALQRDRLNVRPTQRFRAEVVAGHPRAVELQAVIEKHGLTLGESSGVRESPDQLAAITALETIHERFGGVAIIGQTFDVVIASWPGAPGRFRGEIIMALATVIGQDEPDIKRLIDTLADDRPGRLGNPDRLMYRSMELRKGEGAGGGSYTYTVRVIRGDYTRRRPSSRRR